MDRPQWATYSIVTDSGSTEESGRFHSNVEFRLPPIAIADMPHYNNEQQSILTRLSPSRFDLAELGQGADVPQESHTLLTSPVNSDLQYPRSTPLQSEQCSELETRPTPSKDLAPKAYTFVNVQTSTGRRDRAAESQIRSHAMKRVQQKRRQSKQLLPTASGISSSLTKVSCPCWRQDPRTHMCPCMGSPSTGSQGTVDVETRLNIAQPKNAPSLVPSGDTLSESDYCHCGQVKFMPHVNSNAVLIRVPTWSLLSSFLSFLNKADRNLSPHMESMLNYRKWNRIKLITLNENQSS